MEQICGIYCVENIINNKKYIGLSKDIHRRWLEHKRVSFNKNSKEYNYPLYNAIRKYGIENFNFYILEECAEDELKEKEKYWINYYNSNNIGYNITPGGEFSSLSNEKHPCAKLTKSEVEFCRLKYSEGCKCQDIYQQYFSDKITLSGFKNMWFGRSWKNIMPEVFENNPNPRRKITDEDILDIRTKFFQGMLVSEIDELYKDKYSHATISQIINNKRFTNIQPNIEDNHRKANKKITDEDVRLIKKLKKEGYLHKDIRAALNNKVSMTTISDIVNNKKYSDIE